MRMMFLYLLPAIFLAGCGGDNFLTRDSLDRLSRGDARTNRTLYFDRVHQVFNDGHIVTQTHGVLLIGNNVKSTPDVISVFDGSIQRLIGFQARIVHPDNSTDTYGKGDLSTYALSTRDHIADEYLKILPIQNRLKPGDLVEMVTTHEQGLGPLGISFSVDEAGERAQNVRCTIILPPGDTLLYKVANDTLTPLITDAGGQTTYSFSWQEFSGSRRPLPFEKVNQSPHVLAAVFPRGRLPRSSNDAWRAFGDWYLGLIEPKLRADSTITSVARALAKDRLTPVEICKAIAAWCQHNVRYEQVYIAGGEFIPNDASSVFARRYGDCKDYSTLIYAMATSVGLHPHLALCYRGRGYEFHDDVPVAQFNHMIVSLTEGGQQWWFDGTNRFGSPGTTDESLMNAPALVLERGATHISKIGESPDNRFDLSAVLRTDGDDLKGRVTVTLWGQFATIFPTAMSFRNENERRNLLTTFLTDHINSTISISSIQWSSSDGVFTTTAECILHNVLTNIDRHTYISFARLFPLLLREDDPHTTRPFYYPDYSRVKALIELPEFVDPSGSTTEPYRHEVQFDLPAGPFTSEQQAHDFMDAYAKASTSMQANHKLSRKAAQ